MFKRDRADSFEVALEDSVGDRHLDAVAGKSHKAFDDRVDASSNYREVDEADCGNGSGARAPALGLRPASD